MTRARETFLQRVQQALAEGKKAGTAADIPPRGTIGYQGAAPDPVTRFRDELTAAGGQPHLVPDAAAARACTTQLVHDKAAARALLGGGSFIDTLDLGTALRAGGIEVSPPGPAAPGTYRDTFFAAEIGITGVDYLVAETGSVAVLARPGEPRSFSLLPPVHIAVAHHSQLVPDLFDLFALLPIKPGECTARFRMPSCLTLITGPSKTGDIELRLVTGVHGPGELHVVLVTG